MTVGMEPSCNCEWPAAVSATAGPPPLNGTCVRLTPAISLNSSVLMCGKPPTPEEEYMISPGRFLASAMNSFTEFTGR